MKKCRISNTECRIQNAEYRTPNRQLGIRHSEFGFSFVFQSLEVARAGISNPWKSSLLALCVIAMPACLRSADAAATNALAKTIPVLAMERTYDDGENKDNLPLKFAWSNAVFAVDEGRGESASIGSYSIRAFAANYDHSDELMDFIAGVVRPRDGGIEKCWVTDLDGDGKPEVVVWIECAGSGGYGTLDIFTFDGKKLNQVAVPELAARKEKSYHGHDRFKIEDGAVICEFPLYLGEEAENSPKGGKIKYEFDFKNKQWKRY